MINEIFKPEISLRKWILPLNDKDNNDSVEFQTSRIGKYPAININGVEIDSNDVISFKLYNNGFLPHVDIIFNDSSNKMTDEEFPLDGQIVSILINTNAENLWHVRMDFLIETFTYSKNPQFLQIVGRLHVPYMFETKFTSFKDTSFNTLKTLAKKAELGFKANVKSSDDSMVWINPADDNISFIKKITEHSYISDSSFLWTYIDFGYSLNYIDLEKALSEDSSKFNNISIKESLFKDKEAQYLPMELTNHPDFSSSNLFFKDFKIVNSSTKTNIELGYKTQVRQYDRINHNIQNTFIDSISTTGDDNGAIIMKGSAGLKDGIAENCINDVYLGDYDIDNVHANYLYAYQQNRNNLLFLEKIKMSIILKNLNFNLFRFQLVPIKLYKLQEMPKDKETKKPLNDKNLRDMDKDKLNTRLSGDWLITGINYIFDKKDGIYQELVLVKRELNN